MEPIKVNRLVKTGNRCPSQWEGDTIDERMIYIRYRFGRLYGKVGKDLDFVHTEDCLFIFRWFDEYFNLDGYMTTSRMIELTKEIFNFEECEIDNTEEVEL